MNSLPSFEAGHSDTAAMTAAAITVSQRKRSTPAMTGRYDAIRNRFSGFFASGRMRPRIR